MIYLPITSNLETLPVAALLEPGEAAAVALMDPLLRALRLEAVIEPTHRQYVCVPRLTRAAARGRNKGFRRRHAVSLEAVEADPARANRRGEPGSVTVPDDDRVAHETARRNAAEDHLVIVRHFGSQPVEAAGLEEGGYDWACVSYLLDGALQARELLRNGEIFYFVGGSGVGFIAFGYIRLQALRRDVVERRVCLLQQLSF